MMTLRLSTVRRAFALLMVVLGVVIAARGVAEAAPFSFVAMGVLLAILGALRLGRVVEGAGGKGGHVRRRNAGR